MPLAQKRLFPAIALLSGLLLTSACASDSPSSPSNPNNPGNPPNPNAPRIVSLAPTPFHPRTSAQVITVIGERFTSGLTVLLDSPNGVWTTYSGSAIVVQSPTTFTVTAMLDRVGVWDITVTSADGLESNEMQFSVGN